MMIDENILYKNIGQKIKEIREGKLTQEELAKRIGVSRASIANYEIGKQAIYISDLYKIADCLESQIRLFLPSLEEIKTKSSLDALLDGAPDLDEEEIKEIKEFIKESKK